jgi:hypothetical protein
VPRSSMMPVNTMRISASNPEKSYFFGDAIATED